MSLQSIMILQCNETLIKSFLHLFNNQEGLAQELIE